MSIENICDKYVCTLPPKFVEKAKVELGETESKANECLEQIREWIRKHPNIQECRMDSNFLLRFLRKTKYNMPVACKVLENYLMAYQHHPKWVEDIEYEIPRMQEVIDSGFAFVLPDRDAEGRRVVMCRFSHLDAKYFNYIDIIRIAIIIMDLVQSEEESQIAGFVFIIDASHTTLRHIMMCPISEMIYLVKSFLLAFPIRFASCHVINMPWCAIKLADIAKKLMSKKLSQRINFVNSMEEFHSRVDPKLLPKEYGGDVPIEDIMKQSKNRLEENNHKNLLKVRQFTKTNFKHFNI